MKTFSIGRDASNPIILNDNFVSRRHAELIISDNGQVMIKDLGSSNGTFVNGNRISECYIKPGDIVKCASVFLNWQQYITRSSSDTGKSFASPPLGSEIFSDPIQQSANKPEKQQPVSPVASSSVQNQQANPPQPMQQNVIILGKAKSVGVAFILAFLFGPLGLLYASVAGGIIMFIIAIPLAIITLGISIIFTNLICCVWAVVAANQANSALQNQAGGLMNNYYQNK